jgi:hypothetical protein
MAPRSPERNTLNIFLSYAHEDDDLLSSIYKCLQAALDPTISVINFDKKTFEEGESIHDLVKSTLDDSDILVPIQSKKSGPNFGYTGFEVGYFEGIMNLEPRWDFVGRKIVPISVGSPIAATADRLNVALGITPEALQGDATEYARTLQVNVNHAMVKFLAVLESYVAQIKQHVGLASEPPRDLIACVRTMCLEIFGHLKQTEQSNVRPQKKIVIRTSDQALAQQDADLPSDATIVPSDVGSPFSIFGIPSKEMTWDEFRRQTAKSQQAEWWCDSIRSVVSSSIPNRIDVDNSQILMASDEKTIYRLILSSSILYYNGNREFHLYFVEMLKRNEFGDRKTTLLLKGLDLVCRARFLFLERSSEFTEGNVATIGDEHLPDLARRLVSELNLLGRDAHTHSLDQPRIWAEFTDWTQVSEMVAVWRPCEEKLRELATNIKRAESDIPQLGKLRIDFAKALKDTADGIREHNSLLLARMADQLKLLSNAGP